MACLPKPDSGAGGAADATAEPAARRPCPRRRSSPTSTGRWPRSSSGPSRRRCRQAARAALDALSERFGLVGCVSGRRAEEARRLVGVDEIAYAGNHGLELLLPGEDGAAASIPRWPDREGGAAEFLAELDAEELARAGLRLEDKGPIQALHWRGAEDERARRGAGPRDRRRGRAGRARTALGPQGARAAPGRRRRQGRRGGGAAGRPTGSPPPSTPATTAPTSTPSAACASCARTASWRRASASASLSPEAPPELAEESDLTVDGPDGWLAILESLAE